MKDLAPSIVRQRLVIEGIPSRPIDAPQISEYLDKLGSTLDMRVLNEPVTHNSEKFGWAGWIHWESSGAHFYAWNFPTLFFSVDIYTCKTFEVGRAVEVTRQFFEPSAIEYKSF
jgi:hypothetical protein